MSQGGSSSQQPSSVGAGAGLRSQDSRNTAQGSGTQTQTQTPAQAETSSAPRLNLLGAQRPGPHVRWDPNVVDNEGMGRKSSKVCCIYHAPEEESSEGESSSDSSDSDSDSDSDPSRRANADRAGKDSGRAGRGRRNGKANENKKRNTSPNAYEKVPKPRKGGPSAST